MILKTIRRYLEPHGFSVLSAENASAALASSIEATTAFANRRRMPATLSDSLPSGPIRLST